MGIIIHVHVHGGENLNNLGEAIMTAISDFAAKQNAFNDQMDTAITGLTADIKFLGDTILQLQTSPGTLTARSFGVLKSPRILGSWTAKLPNLTLPTRSLSTLACGGNWTILSSRNAYSHGGDGSCGP